jgi:hypothetical protein
MLKWQIVLASALALLILIASPLSLLAANHPATLGTTRSDLQGGLAIVAPRVTNPGLAMSLTVFQRQNQTPVEGVQVWTLNRESIKSYKDLFKAYKNRGQDNTAPESLQSLLESNASLIGETNPAGKLSTTFNTAGFYILVAVKPGYIPGWQFLLVRNILVIKGPESAVVGETSLFSLTDKASTETVAGVQVWAIAKADLPALKAALKKDFLAPRGDLSEADWNAILKSKARLLGATDQNGQVEGTFTQEGKYLVLAVMEGKIAGLTLIVIESP